MRTAGIAVVAAVAGLVAGFVLGEIIAIVGLLGFGVELPAVRFLAPVAAVAAAIAVPLFARRARRGGPRA